MRNPLFLLASVFALSCVGGHGGDDDPGETSGPTDDSSVTGDDTGPNGPQSATCTIRGTVTVQLYTYDSDGELEYVSFQDAYGGSFPFGAVWVTGYSPDGAGGIDDYVGAATFHNPSTAGDAYEITATLDEAGEVRLFGMLDYWNDRILGSGEPTGMHPDAIDCTDGSEHEDVDITILAPYYDFDGGGSGGGGGSGTGSDGAGSGCDLVRVEGDILITNTYAGGEAAAMLLDANRGGPHYWDFTDPTPSGGGATSAYGFQLCDNFGTANLVGCWDTDGNLLFDPADTWGAYISAPSTDGNPISVGTTDLTGYDIEVPLADGESPWGIVPFVTLAGDLFVDNGVFDDLPSGTTVYVTALKYRPSGDIAVATLNADAYDIESFTWSELSGQSQVSWTVNAPANTIVYLWAYADTDGDGVVNEVNEHVASGGINSSGKLPTGSSSTSGIQLGLGTPN